MSERRPPILVLPNVTFQKYHDEDRPLPYEATPAKVELGKMLFFDPRLSASHAISCASCHNLSLGGADAEPTSIGHQWQHGGRNAPTVLNAAWPRFSS